MVGVWNWQLSPRATKRWCNFSLRTIRKNYVEFMCAHPLHLLPAGCKLKMDNQPILHGIQDGGSLTWLPCKNRIMAFVAEQAPPGLFRHRILTRNWWRRLRRRHLDICQRTPSMASILAETQRVMSMLTKDQCEQWFHQHLCLLAMVVGFNARSVFNKDESTFVIHHMDETRVDGSK